MQKDIKLTTIMVAEKATLISANADRIMDAIDKTFSVFDGPVAIGGTGRFLGKLLMTQYTFEDLGGKMKAQVRDGQRLGMFEVMDLEDDALAGFIDFRRAACRRISWEQSAALYWSQKMPDCWLVSESEQVLEIAQRLDVPTMTLSEMQEAFLVNEELEMSLDSHTQSSSVAPFDPRVDAVKVEAAFNDGLDGELAVLKQKSYWAVVCVLFEWFGWLRLRRRADFCRWVNAHFHFSGGKPIDSETDIKSAVNKIKVKERNLELWPDNSYRDLAFLVRDKFFGERQVLPSGFYVYANEIRFLKPGKTWTRKDW